MRENIDFASHETQNVSITKLFRPTDIQKSIPNSLRIHLNYDSTNLTFKLFFFTFNKHTECWLSVAETIARLYTGMLK